MEIHHDYPSSRRADRCHMSGTALISRLRIELMTAARALDDDEQARFWLMIDDVCALSKTMRVSVDEEIAATGEAHLRALLEIIDRTGGFMKHEDQTTLYRARAWLGGKR